MIRIEAENALKMTETEMLDARSGKMVRIDHLDHGSEFGAHRIHDDGSWNGHRLFGL